MTRLKVIIKDQFDKESIALAKVRPMNDHALELHKSVEHIEINDDIILPNMDCSMKTLETAKFIS